MSAKNRTYAYELPYVLEGWLLRLAFEHYIRPNWDLLSYGLSKKVLDVYYKQADPDELVITKADLDDLSDEQYTKLMALLEGNG